MPSAGALAFVIADLKFAAGRRAIGIDAAGDRAADLPLQRHATRRGTVAAAHAAEMECQLLGE